MGICTRGLIDGADERAEERERKRGKERERKRAREKVKGRERESEREESSEIYEGAFPGFAIPAPQPHDSR